METYHQKCIKHWCDQDSGAAAWAATVVEESANQSLAALDESEVARPGAEGAGSSGGGGQSQAGEGVEEKKEVKVVTEKEILA